MSSAPLVSLGRTPPAPCPYLPDRAASLRFYESRSLSPDDFDVLLAQGFRRQGRLLYRPECAGCGECVPIRVPVAAFAPSRSQRRLLRRAADLYQVAVGPPSPRSEHVELFNRHARRVSPSAQPLDEARYREFLIESATRTLQLEYRLGGRLVGASYLDLGRQTASSIYCFWDPDFAALSPGTFSVLCELGFCRANRLAHYYLGYWVRDCPSMAYKSRFRPCEVLDWRRGNWAAFEG
jgi:arginine-tRNA-protein transferase